MQWLPWYQSTLTYQGTSAQLDSLLVDTLNKKERPANKSSIRKQIFQGTVNSEGFQISQITGIHNVITKLLIQATFLPTESSVSIKIQIIPHPFVIGIAAIIAALLPVTVYLTDLSTAMMYLASLLIAIYFVLMFGFWFQLETVKRQLQILLNSQK